MIALPAALVPFAIGGGVALGVAGGLVAGRRLLGHAIARCASPRLARTLALVGAVVAAAPGVFFAFMIGGNFGGGFGEELFGLYGVPAGICAGIAVVLLPFVAAGYAVAGRLSDYSLRDPEA